MRLKNLDEEISHSAVSAAQNQRIVELWMWQKSVSSWFNTLVLQRRHRPHGQPRLGLLLPRPTLTRASWRPSLRNSGSFSMNIEREEKMTPTAVCVGPRGRWCPRQPVFTQPPRARHFWWDAQLGAKPMGPSRPRLVLFLILSLRRKTSVSLMKIIKWEREFQFKITSVRGDTLETWLSSEAWPRGHLEPVSTLSFGGERSRDMFLLKGEGLLNCHCPHRLRSPHHNGETEADRKQSVEC